MKKFLKNLTYPLIASILTAVLILGILKIGFTTNFFKSPNTTTRTLETEGTGSVTSTPDTAEINFGVTNTQPTTSQAQQQTNQTISKILDQFKTLGIDSKSITTSNYSIYPQYNYTGNSQTPSGYSVTQNIDVKITPIDKAGKAIDVATTAGANMLGSINFTFSDQTQSNLEEQARIKAINDAKQKAEDEAKATGIKLVKIINVQEVNNETPIIRPLMMQTANGAKEAGTPTQLPPGQSTVSKDVKVTFEIE